MWLLNFFFFTGRNCLYTCEGSTRWPVQPFKVQVPFSFQGKVQQVSFPFPLRRKKCTFLKNSTGKQTEHLLLPLQLAFNLLWGNPSNNRYAPIFIISRQLFYCRIDYVTSYCIYRHTMHTRLHAFVQYILVLLFISVFYCSLLLCYCCLTSQLAWIGDLDLIDWVSICGPHPTPSLVEDRTITHTHIWAGVAGRSSLFGTRVWDLHMASNHIHRINQEGYF